LIKDSECGDIGVIKAFDKKVFMGLVDVLGHGKKAHEIAIMCKEYLDKNYQKDIIRIMRGLHEEIRGSRGAVVGLCLLDLQLMELRYVGVGNITARVFGPDTMRLISLPGVVGYVLPTLKVMESPFSRADSIVLYTDGVKENFKLEEYPEILTDDARTIVKNIIQRFGKKSDDAACMAVRCR